MSWTMFDDENIKVRGTQDGTVVIEITDAMDGTLADVAIDDSQILRDLAHSLLEAADHLDCQR